MSSSKPSNLEIYNKIKEELFKRYPKPSAYRSGLLVQEYKKYMESKGLKPYVGEYKKTSNLVRWFQSNWTNQRGEIGYRYKSDIYRPNIKVDNKVPASWNELTPQEIKKAREEKYRTGRVKRFKE
jgi:hypothetical protein